MEEVTLEIETPESNHIAKIIYVKPFNKKIVIYKDGNIMVFKEK